MLPPWVLLSLSLPFTFANGYTTAMQFLDRPDLAPFVCLTIALRHFPATKLSGSKLLGGVSVADLCWASVMI